MHFFISLHQRVTLSCLDMILINSFIKIYQTSVAYLVRVNMNAIVLIGHRYLIFHTIVAMLVH